jgi:hypothetical protein
MRAGVIGFVRGEFDEITSLHETSVQDGMQFMRSLQVSEKGTLDTGHRYYTGEAAIEIVEKEEYVRIDSDTGEIEVGEEGTTKGKYTKFVAVPSKFIAVGSSRGTFAFSLLQELHPGIQVDRARLDLNSYADDYYQAPNVNPWQVGFYGNIGEAEKGIVYGENVISDEEIGEVLDRSQVNQLGLQYEMLGYDMKMTMTKSGYVEVYNPSNLDSEGFAEYLVTEILDYVDME